MQDFVMTPYYQHAGITIYNADCREWFASVPECLRIDTAITDPPYGVGFTYLSHDDSRPDYWQLIRDVFQRTRAVSDTVMLTTGMRNLWMYPPADWVLCWAKPGSTRRSDLGGFNEWEPVFVYGKPRIFNDFKYLPDCVNHTSGYGKDHPCPKPLALLKWLVSVGCPDGGTVLDPFMGSGTTLQAAKDLGRKAIGVEIEEKYCEIAAKRLSQEVLDFSTEVSS